MAFRKARWQWLVQQYQLLSREDKDRVIKAYNPKMDQPSPDQALYQAFSEVGIALDGSDPLPDPYISPMAAGLEEYEDILAAQDAYEGLR